MGLSVLSKLLIVGLDVVVVVLACPYLIRKKFKSKKKLRIGIRG